jgi:hypothetical protein
VQARQKGNFVVEVKVEVLSGLDKEQDESLGKVAANGWGLTGAN